MKPDPDPLDQILDQIRNPPPLLPPLFHAGVIRSTVADFVVDEIPAYLPEGSGEHSFLWIEKRGLSAGELISRLARILRITAQDIGVAGQKDRHAVTRQFVSVPRRCVVCPEQLAAADIRVLSVSAHRSKLRTGHLKGNRFLITVRHPHGSWTDGDIQQVRQRLRLTSQTGFPSYFGTQRFGHHGSTLHDGIALLQGRLSRKRWPFYQQRMMTRLVLSAVQSAVFNLVTGARVSDRTIDTPKAGDVVIRRDGSRPYLLPVTPGQVPDETPARPDSAETRDRVVPTDRLEDVELRLLPAGPMPGPGMLPATGSVAEAEAEALAKLGLSGDEFIRFTRLCGGTRRAMLAFPASCSAELDIDGHLRIGCELRRGTYVTVLLRELFGSLVDAAVPGQEQADPETDED